MKLFVVYSHEAGEYLSTSRAGWSTNWSLARLFTTAGAATNAARQDGSDKFEVIEGYFKVKE